MGNGINVVRNVVKIVGAKSLPIMFEECLSKKEKNEKDLPNHKAAWSNIIFTILNKHVKERKKQLIFMAM